MEVFKLIGTIVLQGAEKAKKEIENTSAAMQSLKSKVAEYKKTGLSTSESWKKATNDMKESANDSSEGIQDSFRKIGAAVTAYLAVDKIKDFGLSCINAASDAQAMESQFSQVFGDLEGQAADTLSEIADETGIVENRMKGSFTKIAAFAKTTGMDTADSLSLTERALVAVADRAAFYDTTIESTTESLQSFLKGNYENDSALGLSCTETTRNAAANKLYGQSFNDLSEAQKQLTLMQMVEDANALDGALGQAARESDSWTNKVGNLKQAWTDFTAKIGESFLPTVIKVVDKLTEIAQWMTDHQTAVGLIAIAVGTLTAALTAYHVAQVMATVGMTLATAATTAFGTVMAFVTSPITLVVAAIGALIAIGVLLYKNWDTLKEWATKIFSKIAEVISGFVSKVSAFFTETIPNAGKQMVNWFASLPSKMREIGVNIVQGLKNGIAQMWENLKNWFINKVNALVSGVKSILGIASPSKVFAGIGGFMAEGLGEGFDDQFKTVKKDIESNMNFDAANASINVSGNVQRQVANAATATQNTQGSNDRSINLTVVSPDGKELARFIAPYMGAQLQLVRG